MSPDPSFLPLVLRRLESHARLAPSDSEAFLALPWQQRTLEPATYIMREGEPPQHCAVLLDGFVFRQKLTHDGNRQIVALHIPGDPLDLQMLFLAVADHNVQALTRATIATVPRAMVQSLIIRRPALAHAAIVNILIEASIGREWLLNIGRRDARSRLAHLMCEFAFRMDAQGLSGPGDYELPMTQEQLGDALGLTAVHVNRTLKALAAQGVIRRQGRRVAFKNWQEIRDIADFSSLYLHRGDGQTPDLVDPAAAMMEVQPVEAE